MERHGENPLQDVVAVIPARYSSVRLPGKLLRPIAGKPLILHTLERAKQARLVTRVIVATDDQRIFDAVEMAGGEAVMTSSDHRSGTDRVAEVAETLQENSIIVNVQGDEPVISPETIDAAVQALIDDPSADMATTAEPIKGLGELLNGNVVKVITGDAGYAMHFSRSPMPYPRDAALRYGGNPNRAIIQEPDLLSIFRKHTGLYAYRRDYLLKLSKLPATKLEHIEMLEQLRALEDGAKIRVVEAIGTSVGVDTEADLERVRVILEELPVSCREATETDIAEVSRVYVEAVRRSFDHVYPKRYLEGLSVETRQRIARERFSTAGYRLFVAESATNKLVGFVDSGQPVLSDVSSERQIYSIYLLPEFQGIGIGKRLFRKCVSRMIEDGASTLCLDTVAASPYRGFYDKLGGTVVGNGIHSFGDTEMPTVVYGWDDMKLI